MSDVIKKGKFSHGGGYAAEMPANKRSPLQRLLDAIKRIVSRRQHAPDQSVSYTAELEQRVIDLIQAQAEIARSEARFRNIVDDQVELVCRYDANLTLTFVN